MKYPILLLPVIAQAASAAVMTNGDFEISSAGDPTFTGWGEFTSDTVNTTRNTAAIIGASTISGTTSAELVAGGTSGGAIRQGISTALMEYTTTLSFAALAPESGATANSRYFSMQLKHGGATSTSQINLRVIETGRLQAFDGMWQDIGTLTANFTADIGNLGAWNGESATVNTLGIDADYSVTPTYSITLNGSTVSGLSYFQGTAPTPGVSGLNAVSFLGSASTKNFLVDDLVVIPEPSVSLLAVSAGLGLLFRRSRKQCNGAHADFFAASLK